MHTYTHSPRILFLVHLFQFSRKLHGHNYSIKSPLQRSFAMASAKKKIRPFNDVTTLFIDFALFENVLIYAFLRSNYT